MTVSMSTCSILRLHCRIFSSKRTIALPIETSPSLPAVIANILDLDPYSGSPLSCFIVAVVTRSRHTTSLRTRKEHRMIRFPKLCDLRCPWTLITILTRTVPVPAHHDPILSVPPRESEQRHGLNRNRHERVTQESRTKRDTERQRERKT
jgi:hypothetical protein